MGGSAIFISGVKVTKRDMYSFLDLFKNYTTTHFTINYDDDDDENDFLFVLENGIVFDFNNKIEVKCILIDIDGSEEHIEYWITVQYVEINSDDDNLSRKIVPSSAQENNFLNELLKANGYNYQQQYQLIHKDEWL